MNGEPTPVPPSTLTVSFGEMGSVTGNYRWQTEKLSDTMYRVFGTFTLIEATGAFTGFTGEGECDGTINLETLVVTANVKLIAVRK